MTLTDSNLRYLLAIHHLAQQNTEVSPLALAQVMGVTKPSVTSILTSLMKQGAVVRRRYGKIYITDRGVLYARYYDALVEKILQHFPLADMGFSPEECYSAAVAMAVSLPAREIDEGVEDAAPYSRGEIYPSRDGQDPPLQINHKNSLCKFYCTLARIVVKLDYIKV